MVRVGTQTPVVPLPAYIPGEPEPCLLSLDAFCGEWVVLFFYPRDFTFVCPTELRAFADMHDEFAAAGAHIVAASTDSYWSHRAWFGSEPALATVRYPVLADTALALGNAFGVLEPDGSALRATFVVDPQGTLRHLAYRTSRSAAARPRRCASCRRCRPASCARSTGAPARRRCDSPLSAVSRRAACAASRRR